MRSRSTRRELHFPIVHETKSDIPLIESFLVWHRICSSTSHDKWRQPGNANRAVTWERCSILTARGYFPVAAESTELPAALAGTLCFPRTSIAGRERRAGEDAFAGIFRANRAGLRQAEQKAFRSIPANSETGLRGQNLTGRFQAAACLAQSGPRSDAFLRKATNREYLRRIVNTSRRGDQSFEREGSHNTLRCRQCAEA